MDEHEFRRLLDLFPVVRPRDYHIELDPSRQSTSRSSRDKQVKEWQDTGEDRDKIEVENHDTDVHDKFWKKLKIEAEKKVGAEEAKRLCLAFQQVHRRLVYEGLSSDAAHSFISRSKNCGQ